MNVIKNEDTAEIVGLCFGDGSLTRRHSGKNRGRLRFQLRGHITEDREHYDSYIKPLFERYVGPVPTTFYENKTPYYGISAEKKKVCNYLVALGVPVGIKEEIEIPQWIFEKEIFMKGFLRGFFDSDGCVFCQKSYAVSNSLHRLIKINFASTSKKLIEGISFLASNLGFKTFNKNPLIRKKEGWKNLYIIRIESNKDVERWFGIVGSHNPKHITKFEVWLKYGFCPSYTTLKERKMLLNSGISIMDILCGSARVAK